MMELTYTAEWCDHPSDSSTLLIGTYSAHVYRYPKGARFTWWAKHLEPDAEDDTGEYEIGRGHTSSQEAGQAAAEDAIRAHHTDS